MDLSAIDIFIEIRNFFDDIKIMTHQSFHNRVITEYLHFNFNYSANHVWMDGNCFLLRHKKVAGVARLRRKKCCHRNMETRLSRIVKSSGSRMRPVFHAGGARALRIQSEGSQISNAKNLNLE